MNYESELAYTQTTVTKVTIADEGWYTCLVRNDIGHRLASAYLRVVDREYKR